MSDLFDLHHEPWPGDGQDGYQCAGCTRDLWLRSSEYEPRGLCDECVSAMATLGQTLVAEIDQLRARQQELLALVARISQSTPLDSEVSEALNQRGALLAKIGTLRAELAAAKREIDPMRGVLASIREDFDLAIGAHDVSDPRHRSHGGQHTNGRCCPFGNVNPSTVTAFRRYVQTIDAALAAGTEGK